MTDASTPCIAVLGTCDTKLDELLYVRTQLLDTHHVRVKLVDVGRTPNNHPAIDITQSNILATIPTTASSSEASKNYAQTSSPDISKLSRNDLIKCLSSRAATLLASLATTQHIHGLVALGGSGGSALAAGVFRELPLGFPKLLVSTMAAGDVSPFVQDTDVAIMYSIVDIAGLNDILCPILSNAAGAIAGMAHAYQARGASAPSRGQDRHADPDPNSETKTEAHRGGRENKRIAITMFGVTTPAVTHARRVLAGYACTPYVFHATGAGGRAMERLVTDGFFDGVLDLTTTELADELVGGVLSAGPHRLEAVVQTGVPQVVSLGALDMVNFGPRESVPRKWTEEGAGRTLHVHNPSVTLMRTTKDECAQLGKIMAYKLQRVDAAGARRSAGGVGWQVWVPRGGVSLLSVEGAPFEDRGADEALFRALKEGLESVQKNEKEGRVRVVERDEDINNPAFVEGMVASLVKMMQLKPLHTGRP